MSKNNPFCLSFGREPDRYVHRIDAYDRIEENLLSISPPINHFLIMGARGSGKTVLLATIANKFRTYRDWIVISLNPARKLLEMLAAELYDEGSLAEYYVDELNLSKFGIGIDIKKKTPISDIQTAIERMVKIASDREKRILIVIDDIVRSDDIVAFSTAYQDLLSKGYPVFMIMTGLFENIYSLQRDKRCSFLMRAEKIIPKPLSVLGMKAQYRMTFGCEEKEALAMAVLTKGYSFAFQVLGYIMWEKECTLEEALPEFDQRMAEYCYEKIWDDLSPSEKRVVCFLAEKEEAKTKDIINAIECAPNSFSVIRDRMIKKGIVTASEHGSIALALPRFSNFVRIVGEMIYD